MARRKRGRPRATKSSSLPMKRKKCPPCPRKRRRGIPKR